MHIYVFSNSPIYRMGNDGSLFPKYVLPSNGSDVPVVITIYLFIYL